jgi:hypothetical protein
VLVLETILLLIGLFQSSTCDKSTTTRGLTAYIIVFSFVTFPIFLGICKGILKLVNMWRKRNDLEEIDMVPNIVEMTFASTGRLMDFYEDFYAVSIVSYIYY